MSGPGGGGGGIGGGVPGRDGGSNNTKPELGPDQGDNRKSQFVANQRQAKNETKLKSKDPSNASKEKKKEHYLYLRDAGKWSDFLKHVKTKSPEALIEEYQALCSATSGQQSQRKIWSDPKAWDRARYMDVGCWEENRVVLNLWSKEGFIHANYVDGFRQKRQYILTQAPTIKTQGEFWEMVVQEGTCLILMLCGLVEGGREKCIQYWPMTTQPSLIVGGRLSVSLLGAENLFFGATQEMVVKSNLHLSGPGIDRQIVHFQYEGWPDRDVPDAVGSIMDLSTWLSQQLAVIQNTTSKSSSPDPAPIVVHCSAGIGRSGTFAAIDIIRACLKLRGKVEVSSVIHRLREQRWGSVQRPIQYLYVYISVLYFLRSHKMGGRIEVEDYFTRYKNTCLRVPPKLTPPPTPSHEYARNKIPE